jgi:putative sterol carrier protein
MTTIQHSSAVRSASQPRNSRAADVVAARSARGNAALATVFLPAPRRSVKEMSVRERFATLEERFLPAKAKGINVRFQFKLSGKGGGDWYVEIKNGKVSVKQGSGPNPTATLRASADDYLKIANGEMNKMWAFVRGKLKVEGDKDAIGKFNDYFSGNSAK